MHSSGLTARAWSGSHPYMEAAGLCPGWQLAQWPLGTMAARNGATHRCLGMPRRLGPQPGLRTRV